MEKKISVKDIAEELNISLSTVHKALTGKTGISEARRQEVIKTAQRMGYVVNTVAQSLARKDINIGIAMPSKWHDYFADMKNGIEKEIEALSEYKVRGTFYFLSSDISKAEADKFMVWLADEKIDALIYCPSIYSFEEDFFGRIKKVGIPVFFAGDGYEDAGSISVITTDAELSGKLAADFLHCIKPDGLKAAVLTGSLKVKPHKIKTEAFQKRINAGGGNIVGVYETEDDDKKAYEYMDEIVSKGANAVYVSTATSLSVCRYIEEKGLKKDISLICTDLFDELNYYMKKNIVKATIYQHQESVGERAVKAAYDYFVGKNSYGCDDIEIEPVISVRPSLYLLADIE